ncbi:hypothetical protein PM082_024786 [Marasmius tenuissimus]|nr:hypothetical protein PM082_024786 [Marasmius tenuissimus]
MNSGQPVIPQVFVTSLCLEYPRSCHLMLADPVLQSWVLLCYGIHLVLFAACLSVLAKRRPKHVHIHCFLVVALFVLATCEVILNTSIALLKSQAMSFLLNYPLVLFPTAGEQFVGPQKLRAEDVQMPSSWNLMRSMGMAEQGITVTSNLVTDIILLWRCYHIWGARRRIVLGPALLCFFNNVLGCLTMIGYGNDIFSFINLQTQRVVTADSKLEFHSILLLCFSYGSLCSNVLLTGLIAGRVFYLSRQFSTLSQRPVAKIYRTIIHASIESGVLYPMALFAYTVLLLVMWCDFRDDDFTSPIMLGIQLSATWLYASLIPIMGIASTLIIVRTALGKAINDEQSFRVTVLGEVDGENGSESPGMTESILEFRRRDESEMAQEERRLEGLDYAWKRDE